MPGVARHTPLLTGNKAVRFLITDTALLPHLGELIAQLTRDGEWYEAESTIDDVLLASWDAVLSWYSGFMIGQIASFLGTLPPYWLALDGSTHDQADFPELVALLDAQFRDDPAGEFTLPDMSDVFLVGAGSSYGIGDTGGANDHVLTDGEMPSHSHGYTMPTMGAVVINAGAPVPVVTAVTPGTPTSSAGSGSAHENRPPYFAVAWGILAGR